MAKERTGSSNHLKLEHMIKHNPVIQKLYSHGMSAAFRVWGALTKTDEKLVLMNGHSYKYNDSPRAIYRKMLELGMVNEYKVVWALNDPDSVDIPGCQKVKMDTMEYFKTALRAKYWISCVNIERGLRFKKKDQVYLNTWHGGAINACGNAASGRKDYHWGYIDYFCVVGKYDEVNYGRDMELNPQSFLRTGYPRNDVLSNVSSEAREQMRSKLKIPKGKKTILYAPTWRDSTDGGATFQIAPPIDWEKWKAQLGAEYVVMLRTHPYTTKLMNVQFDDFVMDYTSYPEINDLFIAADILISDYSGVLLDYAITEKPEICFGYDYEEYRKARGEFYYDLDKELPNGVLKTEDEVIQHIQTMNYEEQCRITRAFKKKHCEYETGDATIRCINAVFGTSY